MKFWVQIAGQDFEVQAAGSEVIVNGRTFPAVLVRLLGTPVHQLVSERTARLYALSRQADGWVVQRGGESWRAEVVDERTRQVRSQRRATTPARALGVVKAPMPGLVVRVEVAVGQPVAAGGGLVVLEAMKMENEICSPGAGTVRAVLVEPGQVVEKDAPLIELAGEG